MVNYDLSDLRREMVMQGFMIMYLQEEQKKRWEELEQIKQKIKELQNDPQFNRVRELIREMVRERGLS